jgi:cell division protein FtsB
MPQSIYTLSRTTPLIRNKAINRTKKTSKSGGINTTFLLSLFVSLIIIGCFVFYLYLTLQMVNINFNLRAEEEELVNLQDENKNLEAQIRTPLSVGAMQERAKTLELVRADDVRYLQFSTGGSLSQTTETSKNK